MLLLIKILLGALLIAAAINFIIYAAKHEQIKVIDGDQGFTVRYLRIYLWICIVFFLLVSVLILNIVVWQQAQLLSIVLICVLGAIGVPFLLLSIVWKLKVRPEYIIYVGMLGVKKQIYYRDMSTVILTKSVLILKTTLKTYRFSTHVTCLEYFLKRLQQNGVKIERYD